MTLLEQVRSGSRKVRVSVFQGSREVEYSDPLTFEEARSSLATKMWKGFHQSLPSWQWMDATSPGDYEFDPYGDEVGELNRALRS